MAVGAARQERKIALYPSAGGIADKGLRIPGFANLGPVAAFCVGLSQNPGRGWDTADVIKGRRVVRRPKRDGKYGR
jgi:hypothetical protein